jgi:biopolymer transport protein ExbB/TolQ
VRDTAEKVVVEYRKYRQNRSEFQRATTDLEDLKSMVATASRTASPDVAISMEYTIRKAQRDVEKIIDEAKLHKQQLVDLAGAEAIARLDGQMDKEAEMLNMLIAAPPKDADQSGFKNPLQKPLNEDNVQKPQFADNKDKKGLQL